MQGRILAGIGAWLAGASVATALSLLAVSFLGHDVASDQGPLLSADDVRQLLSDPSTLPGASPPPPTTSTTPTAQTTTPGATTSDPSATESLGTAPASTSAVAVSRVYSSTAGSVVARCQGSLAYLVSWSPAQGYQVFAEHRGPAATAAVGFGRVGSATFIHVSCAAGTPLFSTHSGDDGSGDH